MKICFFRSSFKLNEVEVYESSSVENWFNEQKLNPDDYLCMNSSSSSEDVCVFPKLRGGSSKSKNVFSVVLGLSMLLTGGATAAALFGTGGAAIARTLGVGLLLSGGGGLLFAQTKVPQMSVDAEASANASYQWNVGSLNTTRGIKGVTFGNNVIPEGELIAYRSFGSSSFNSNYVETDAYYSGPNGQTLTVAQYNYQINRNQHKYFGQVRNFNIDSYSYHAASRHVTSISVSKASSFLEMLIGAGEGVLDSISDLKVNDIPVAELELIENQDYCVRLGQNIQASIPLTNLDNQTGYLAVSQVAPQKTASENEFLLLVTPTACDKADISFQANAWYMYDINSGAKNNAYISVLVEYREVGTGAWLKGGVGRAIRTDVPLKSNEPFYFSSTIQFPTKNTYEIRIKNLSAEANFNAGLLTASEYETLPDRASIELVVDNIACYDNIAQTFPNTALIYLKLPATQILNGSMPKITWKQSRSSVFVHDGSGYITKPANNLAWAIYDLFAQVRKDNFNGSYKNLGEDVENIDYGAFVDFAAFCTEIKATGNWFLNRQRTAWETAQDIAFSARAFIGIKNGKISPFYDKPGILSQIFTSGNTISMSGGLISKTERATCIEASFNDENNDYKETTLSIGTDASYDSSNALSLTFAALSSAAAVYSQAEYLIRRNKYLAQTVTIEVGIDSLVSEMYDIIGVQSDIMEWGAGGRVYAVDGYKIVLDTVVTLESGKTYALLIRHRDGTLERKVPDEKVGSFSTLTFSKQPFAFEVLAGDVFSFGVSSFEVKPFRIESITRASDKTAQIEAIEYNENVYVEGSEPIINYSVINAGINSLTKVIKDNVINLAWSAPNALHVDVYINGVFYQRSLSDSVAMPAINGEYSIKLVPVAADGTQGEPFEETINTEISRPSTLKVPTIERGSGSYILTFTDVAIDENLILIVVRENGIERARRTVHGSKVVVGLSLSGGQHFLEAVAINIFGKESEPVQFETPVQTISGWNIGVDSISKDGVSINSNGTISGNYSSGATGWQLDKNGNAEFNNIKARGTISSSVFAQREVSTVGGELLVRPGATVTNHGIDATDRFQTLFNIVKNDILGSDSEFGESTMKELNFTDYNEFTAEEERCFDVCLKTLYDLENTAEEDLPKFLGTTEAALLDDRIFVNNASAFSVSDIIRVKAGASAEFWGVVSEVGEDEMFGGYINVLVEHGEYFAPTPGQTIVNYGSAGSGGILLDGEQPKIDLFVNNGLPWLGVEPFMRLGNIKGVGGILNDTYGLFVGKQSAHHLKYDAGTGLLKFTGALEGASGTFSGDLNAASGTFRALQGGSRCFSPTNGFVAIGTSFGGETSSVWIRLLNTWTILSNGFRFGGVFLIKIYESLVQLTVVGATGRPGKVDVYLTSIWGKQLDLDIKAYHYTNGQLWLYIPPVTNNAWTTIEVLESMDDYVLCQKNTAPGLTIKETYNLSSGGNNSTIVNGTILNWGHVYSSSGTTVNFDTPFSNTNFIVVIDDDVKRETWTKVDNKTTTGFTFDAQHVIDINWIAIGR